MIVRVKQGTPGPWSWLSCCIAALQGSSWSSHLVCMLLEIGSWTAGWCDYIKINSLNPVSARYFREFVRLI